MFKYYISSPVISDYFLYNLKISWDYSRLLNKKIRFVIVQGNNIKIVIM